MYDYLGYYDICYIGDEVKNPGRAIPRSILISVVAVAAIYIAINFSIIGVVPWREFVPAASKPEANFIVSIFIERIFGRGFASIFTVMVLWTAFGSCFALLLGYSRIPFAAARDGYFFRIFGRLHPSKHFPAVSLVVIGLVSIARQFFQSRSGNRRFDHDADTDSIRRSDRRRMVTAPFAAGDAAALSYLAVSDTESDRPCRLDIHFRDD